MKVCILQTYFVILRMKRILSKRTIVEFYEKHPDARKYLETWYETVRSAEWQRPSDIKEFYAGVTILKDSRVVFNIKGNDYRLIAKINYSKQWMFIRFIGTHSQYDKIDADTI